VKLPPGATGFGATLTEAVPSGRAPPLDELLLLELPEDEELLDEEPPLLELELEEDELLPPELLELELFSTWVLTQAW
jgi:hypothetical protein